MRRRAFSARTFTPRLPVWLLLPLAALQPTPGFAARDTTTAVLLSSNSVNTGQQVQIKAQVFYTVTVTTAIFPSGTVDFTSGGTAIPGCTGQALSSAGAANGNAYAYCTTSLAQAGVFTIAANYNGDSSSNASSGSARLTVAGASVVSIQVTTLYQQVLQPLTLAATVTNTSGLPITGTVDFTNNGSAIAGCTGMTVTAGVATCTTSFPQTGSYTVAANYNGDSLNQPASGSAAVTIGKLYATPYVSAYVQGGQVNGSFYLSQPITVDATFSPAAGAPAPTGTATFYDGSTALATVALGAGGYLKMSARFAMGPHTVTVVYGGDADYLTSTTPAASFSIGKTPTTPYITSIPGGSQVLIYGEPVIVGATFPPPPGSTVAPTGSVAFYDGAAQIAAGAIDATGHAGLLVPSGALPPFSVGTHAIKAVYAGDDNYLPSDTSAAGLLSVSFMKAPVCLAVSATRFQSGRPVTIYATAVVDSPGIVTAGGTVDFSSGGGAIPGCTGVALANGAAQCTATFTQAATVNVMYSGDANTQQATAPVTLSSDEAIAGIYVESATTSPVLGQTATIDVRLTAAPGTAPPTGPVTFTDQYGGASVSLGSAAVGADGHALLVTAALGLGDHTITASYGGDANYQPSSAPPVTVSVEPDPDSLTVSAPAATVGQPLTVTAAAAAISPGTATPTGTVSFYGLADSPIGTCMLAQRNGGAQCSAAIARLDTLSMRAVYAGDANNAGGSASVQLSSAQALAGMYVTPSSATPAVGTPVTITAVLTSAAGVVAPTGTVTFSDNGVSLGTAAVGSNGQASTAAPSNSVAALTVGNHEIAAAYSGDAKYAPSSATALEMVVTKATTKMDLAATPAQAGEPVTMQAAVTVLGPGTPAQGGTVDFFNSSTAIAGCSGVALANGIAQCTTMFAQLGAYVINASYSGGPNTTAVTASLQLTVGKLTPGFYAAAYSTSLPYGAGVGITALAMGTPTPTGSVTFSDGAATLATMTLGPDGTAPLAIPSKTLPPLAVGTHSIVAAYSGDGNYQAAAAQAIVLTIAKASTSVALASPPPQVDQPVALKAAVTVASPGNATPAGTVDFLNGGSAIPGCMGLAPQNAAAYCTTTFSQLGNYTITARYNGDANTNASSATMQVAAGKAEPGVYLASSPTAPVFGLPVTIGALVLGAAGLPAPTGSVTFADGATPLGYAPLGPDGHAAITLAAGLAAVPHTFTASYAGDAHYAAASATLSVIVPKAATLTSLAAAFGAPLVATVNVLAPAGGTPTGAVQFLVSGTAVGTAALAQQNGAFTATLPAGTWTGNAWAVYQGDANFTGSVSPSIAITAGALVSIAADRNPAAAGQAVTFTVSVAPSSGSVTPTGQLQVAVDSSTLGTAALVSGKAVFTAPALATGSHTITANYLGDSVYPPASATLVEIVSQSIASLSLTASSNATVYGQAVTLTAQVTGQSGGTVQFSDGPASIGSAAVSSGAAVLTVSNLAAGSHSVSALWTGDNGAAASAPPVTIAVRKAETETLLASTGVTLAAVVTAVAPGAGVPTGSVKFTDTLTNSVFASAPLAGGAVVTAQPATADPIVALYSGDTNFEASVSSPLTPLAAANAASFTADSFAPDEIVTLFGSNLATAAVSATGNPLPTLGGATASVTDSAGVRHAAALLFISPSQASLVVPADTAAGAAVIALTNPVGITFTTAVTIANIAPGIFTADGSGKGAPAGQVIRVHADGSQDASESISAAPIDLGASSDTVYLLLYGTGIRHQSSATAAFTCSACTAGDLPVAFAGAQPSIMGLDQVNLAIPQSLRGAGQALLTLSVDGVSSNTVMLSFQ
jgi:hypothetical protein